MKFDFSKKLPAISQGLRGLWGRLRREGTFTLLVIPHSARGMLRFSFPRWMAMAAGGVAIGIVLLVLGVFVSYGLLVGRLAQDAALRRINLQEASQMAKLYGETAAINREMERIRTMDREVRRLVGRKANRVPGNPVSFQPGHALSNRGGIQRGERLAVATRTRLELLRRQLPGEEVRVAALQRAVREENGFLRAVPQGWPAYGRISSPFGWRINPVFDTREFHEGVDIALSYGTPLRATGSGQVQFVGWQTGYGRVVIVDDGYGYSSLYSHLSRFRVHQGEWIHRGEIVAYVGDSGWSTGPHVYYQIFLYGRPVNPAPYLGLALSLNSAGVGS